MAIRVVARIRPRQQNELGNDVIVSAVSHATSDQPTLVKIPNPKNQSEAFTFEFSSVYDHFATQQQIFDNEVSPTIKHLFNGFDVTIFAYGSTGTGKTHTMRGGKTLTERGVIPRLLSGIYRRARKIDKDSAGKATVEIGLSYYEIYNDRVFDLFQAPDKRTLAGLPLRENQGKTMVVGLTERPCESLKKFETLYDQANINRSTSATKLNSVSSRSHAILGIKLTVTTEDEVRTSTASAIDLAGSEDNRRAENRKERMVESASINKSLFVLAKCVEAISSDSARIPYRESKMTRILSLGQNNGMTIMILNLAPVRSYHNDTLSSLNFANRTKKIEVREIENEPVFKGCSRAVPTFTGLNIQRQPLRPLANNVDNSAINSLNPPSKPSHKQAKAFWVYSDQGQQSTRFVRPSATDVSRLSSPRKRPTDPISFSVTRPRKRQSPASLLLKAQPTMSKEAIEGIIEKKVTDLLAARALDQPSIAPPPEISEEVQRRLDLLEQKIDGRDDGREQGLTFLLMAKQHAARGEDASALRMFILAKGFFPDNEKLDMKIGKLKKKIQERKEDGRWTQTDKLLHGLNYPQPSLLGSKEKTQRPNEDEEEYHREEAEDQDYESDAGFEYSAKAKKSRLRHTRLSSSVLEMDGIQTPRTKQLLEIVNTRDISRIRLLKGVGPKRAEAVIKALCAGEEDDEEVKVVHNLGQLGQLKGLGPKLVENWRAGLQTPLASG